MDQPVELYRRHRPTSLGEVRGQDSVIKVLRKHLEKKTLPHCLLFMGPTGVGKTTVIRILKDELSCSDMDYQEVNAAEERGIERVRQIVETLHYLPSDGPCKIYALDEVHNLTRRKGGDAQTALLKVLEDCPAHAYFFLATSDPEDLRRTLRGRCEPLKFSALSRSDLTELVVEAARKESLKISEEVADKVAEAAEGSAREALVILGQIVHFKDEDEQLNAITAADTKREAIEIARELFNLKAKPSWTRIKNILKDLDDDPEKVRRMILSYAQSVALGDGRGMETRAHQVLLAFDEPFRSGKASLVRACLEVTVSPE